MAEASLSWTPGSGQSRWTQDLGDLLLPPAGQGSAFLLLGAWIRGVQEAGGWRALLTQVQMESELFFFFLSLSSNLGVIYSFLVVGRDGFSKVLLGVQENQ